MMLLSLYFAVMSAKVTFSFKNTDLVADVTFVSSMIFDFVAKILTWYIAIFKYPAMKNCFVHLDEGFSKSKLHVLSVLLAVGAQEGIILCLGYYYAVVMVIPNLSNLGSPLGAFYRSETFTQTDAEVQFFFVGGTVVNALKSTHIPAALILGHCIGIVRALRDVKKGVLQEKESQKIYFEESKTIQTLYSNFNDICGFCNLLNQTFRFMIVILAIYVGFGIFASIYLQSIMSCMTKDMTIHYLNLASQFLAVFYLCLGGALLQNEVRPQQQSKQIEDIIKSESTRNDWGLVNILTVWKPPLWRAETNQVVHTPQGYF